MMAGDKAVELMNDPDFLLSEGGPFESLKKLTVVRVGPASEHLAVDILACELGGVFVEDVELAAQPEFGREATQDVGKEAVQGSQEEGRHAPEKNGEELNVVFLLELGEDLVEGVPGIGSEFLAGLFVECG